MKVVKAWLSDHWRDPDEGIWEVRGGRKEFLRSRLMCWVAFDRFIRLGSKRSTPGPFERMEADRDAIPADIQENFWDQEVGAFVQYKGAKIVDASALLMPLLRFISPTDPRWLSTMTIIERNLTVDTFVKRYQIDSGLDGLGGRETGKGAPANGKAIESRQSTGPLLGRTGQLTRTAWKLSSRIDSSCAHQRSSRRSVQHVHHVDPR